MEEDVNEKFKGQNGGEVNEEVSREVVSGGGERMGDENSLLVVVTQVQADVPVNTGNSGASWRTCKHR